LITAIVGPDGSGKTYHIDNVMKVDAMHACSRTRWIKGTNDVMLVVKEIAIALERAYTYVMIRLIEGKGDLYLDRCFIDAIVCSRFWSEKTGIKILSKIGKSTVFLSLLPERIILMRPRYGMAEPKRKGLFSVDDIETMSQIYINVLIENDYMLKYKEEYKMGQVMTYERRMGISS